MLPRATKLIAALDPEAVMVTGGGRSTYATNLLGILCVIIVLRVALSKDGN
jgi:hypothetical protein